MLCSICGLVMELTQAKVSLNGTISHSACHLAGGVKVSLSARIDALEGRILALEDDKNNIIRLDGIAIKQERFDPLEERISRLERETADSFKTLDDLAGSQLKSVELFNKLLDKIGKPSGS
jgi:hypothetical protein